MSTKTDVKSTETLHEELQRAEAASRAKSEARAKYIRTRVEDAREQAESQARELYDAEISRLQTAVYEARQAHLGALEREAAARGGNLPVGTILEEWKWETRIGARVHNKLVRTGRKAVYELVTRASRFPEGTAYYLLPRVGDFTLRILKKDGTPSLKTLRRFEGPAKGRHHGFHPEGVDPNDLPE